VREAARSLSLVIPAQAGIQARLSLQARMSQRSLRPWVPAFAGTTRGTPSLWCALFLRQRIRRDCPGPLRRLTTLGAGVNVPPSSTHHIFRRKESHLGNPGRGSRARSADGTNSGLPSRPATRLVSGGLRLRGPFSGSGGSTLRRKRYRSSSGVSAIPPGVYPIAIPAAIPGRRRSNRLRTHRRRHGPSFSGCVPRFAS